MIVKHKKVKRMKKIYLIVLFVLGGAFLPNTIFASQNVPMQIIKEAPVGQNNPLIPPRPWYITQDENVLTIPAFEDDFTLQLLDEDEMVVYSTIISAGTTQVILPTTLSGDFELRLIPFFANYYYRGYISL